jgi:ABC-2 type transport system permease protein
MKSSAITWKDAIIRFTSAWELLFFIVLPIVFTFLLAGGAPSGNEDPRISLLLVDEAKTAISRQIIAELENSTAVRPEVVTRAEAQSRFDDRRADAVFFIPSGINVESLQNGSAEVELLQQPNNINATVAERAVLTAIRRVSSSVAAAQNAVKQREARQPFASEAERQAFFESSLELAQSIQRDAPERVTSSKAWSRMSRLRSAPIRPRPVDHASLFLCSRFQGHLPMNARREHYSVCSSRLQAKQRSCLVRSLARS